MTIANRKLLIDALRSGEFKQAKFKLQDGDKFCCLGVACKIYERETGNLLYKHGTQLFGTSLTALTEYQEKYNYPDEHVNQYYRVREFFGFDDPMVRFHIDYGDEKEPFVRQASFAGLNDNEGYNFNDIADMFEQADSLPTARDAWNEKICLKALSK
jgi:hypothetical protein